MAPKNHKQSQEKKLKEGLDMLKDMVERAEDKQEDYEIQRYREEISTS